MKRSVAILLVWGVVFGEGDKDVTPMEKIPNIEAELLMVPLWMFGSWGISRIEMHISKYINSRVSIGVALGYILHDWYDCLTTGKYDLLNKYGFLFGIEATDHACNGSQRCAYLKPMFFFSYLSRTISWKTPSERKEFYKISGLIIMGIKIFLGPKGFLSIHPNLFVSLYGGLGGNYYFFLKKSSRYIYPNIVIGVSMGYLFKRKKT